LLEKAPGVAPTCLGGSFEPFRDFPETSPSDKSETSRESLGQVRVMWFGLKYTLSAWRWPRGYIYLLLACMP